MNTSLSIKNIAVLPGDGIGPEVMQAAIEVLNAVACKAQVKFNYSYGLIGGAAYDKYNNHFPEQTRSICAQNEAILFGSVGGPVKDYLLPKWNNCEANSLLALRQAFNFNINLRKANIFAELAELSPLKNHLVNQGLDIIIFRELLGDIYFGKHVLELSSSPKVASDVATYTEAQIASISHFAFKTARLRKKKLVSVDKANVLATSKLWRLIVQEIAQQYPDVQLQHMLVDNCAMQLIANPGQFDVILTANLFGDILSDELSMLSGSLGMMPSASFNADGFALYEPAGGSAPDIAGKNIANPIAQILSAALMLDHSFNLPTEAQLINQAIKKTLISGFRTADLVTANSNCTVVGTKEFTAQVIANL
ncbi:MAG: 3-isopropylmalate dehydrogenase [Pseudomonadota bacterium]|jgi:3-isopropylmalate dehydrogenase